MSWRGFNPCESSTTVRVTLHRQDEGDEVDLDACIEARADLRAGAAMSQRLYERSSRARRDTAILVLVDISGSTDAWLVGQRRIIDVEREALLPLCIALDGLGEQYAIFAFSGEGPEQEGSAQRGAGLWARPRGPKGYMLPSGIALP